MSYYSATVTSGEPCKGLSAGIDQGIGVDSSVGSRDLNFGPVN